MLIASRPRRSPSRPRRNRQRHSRLPPPPASRISPTREYQRGHYVTAFKEATRRVEEKSDPKAMTLLGELYADGLGVANDDKKAADWYKLAVARGDREAMFALAMFRMTGRGGPRDRPEAARLLAEAAKLGHVVAAYDLALLYLEGQIVPAGLRPRRRTDAHGRRRRQSAGAIRARHVLQGRPRRDEGPATKPHACSASRRARATPMPRSNTRIALFNGTGIAKNESAAAGYFLKAAQKNNPVAQNRLALMYATGRGIKADPVEAARWHLIAKAGGDNDQFLDEFMRKMKPDGSGHRREQGEALDRAHEPGRPDPVPDGACPYNQVAAGQALTDVAASGHLPCSRQIAKPRNTMDLSWPRSAAATFGRAW